MDPNEQRPTQTIAAALGRLLLRNPHTADSIPGDMFLGRDIFAVRLVRPVIIDGECTDPQTTIDLMDLMDLGDEDSL
jgi:hypothetical protein